MNRIAKDILTVACITGIVCAPALIVFGLVWQQHLNFIQARAGIADFPAQLPQTPPTPSTWFSALAWCVVLALGIDLGYRWLYRAYRATALKRQIARLEKLWQQSTPQENYR
ncbi:MAG: hypothetical protein WCD18_26310 [Thermosynechococcaceae cyanobacterium]